MRLVGLTGGVATGKSTVARQLAEELKFAVVDADQVARWVVEPGRPAYRAVRTAFGDAFFLQDGRLNREKLGRHIFADATARRTLNRCTHPHIRLRLLELILTHFLTLTPVLILDWPLLIESGVHRWLPDVVVVTCPHDVEHQRLMARDNLSAEDATNRINAQMPLEEKCRKATVVIDNAGSLETTRTTVRNLVRRWRPSRATTLLWWAVLAGPATVAWILVVLWGRATQLLANVLF